MSAQGKHRGGGPAMQRDGRPGPAPGKPITNLTSTGG
jgi:hypothetical protein